MCGIAGFIDFSLSQSRTRDVIISMLKETNHRGPDFQDYWSEQPVTLGHNRLSIIDLSDVANQPMQYEDLVITYNGEIYNYLELKEELLKKKYRFSTHSDTEVILASFKEWGAACVEKFVGMWAFAIWDKTQKVLFCSRDRFGIKPFNYININDSFYFSSEIKSLKKTPYFNSEINNNQILRFVQLGWATYKDESFFNSIKSLPEACNLIFRNGKMVITKYWDVINTSVSTPASFEERSNKFQEIFTNSIKLHFRSDVEVGTCLSGGLDSSSIISVAASIFPQKEIKAFNIYYEGDAGVDERPYVYDLVKKYNNISPYYYSPGGDELINELNNIIYHADTPLASSSYVSQFFVMKLAKKYNVKVLLDGQGSDEYLAGYMHTFNRLIGFYLNKGNYSEAFRVLFQHRREHNLDISETFMFLLKGIYSSGHSEDDIFNYELNKLHHILLPNFKRFENIITLENRSADKMTNFFYHLINNTSLPTLLHYEDRNSMAFSIESRVPFLDHRLVEYSFLLSMNDKINKGETKFILRQSLEGVLPDAIKNRKDKKGFVTPGESKWLRGPMKSLLTEDFNNLKQWFDKKQLQKLVDEYKRGNDSRAKLLWRILTLNRWINLQ